MTSNLKIDISKSLILNLFILLIFLVLSCNLTWADEGLYQIVTLNTSQTSLSSSEDVTVNTNTGSTFAIYAFYNVSNNYSQLSGISIRIHYDSSKLEIDNYSDYLLPATLAPIIDDDTGPYLSGGYDYDENTDKILKIAWSDWANQNWPGTGLPLQLIKLIFKVKNDYSEGNTNINVSFKTNANGYEGLSNKALVSLGGKPTVSWSEVSQTKNESDGIVSIKANLNSSYFDDILIDYVVSGSAQTGGEDISLNSTGTLTILEGQQSASLNFTINDDSNYEGDETAIITIQSVTNATIGSNSSHTLTIIDNENIPEVNFSSSTQEVFESATETSAFTIVLSGTSYQDVVVSYSVNGTSTEGQDHNIEDGTITITAGQIEAAKTFNAIKDSISDSNETIIITIDSVDNATKGSSAIHTITLKDPPYNLDVDGNGEALGATDGLLLIRYLYESRGNSLINGVVDQNKCTRCDSEAIEGYLSNAKNAILDVDGNGESLGATDGLLLIRYLYESRGASLINGVVDQNKCTRCDSNSIETYLQTLRP